MYTVFLDLNIIFIPVSLWFFGFGLSIFFYRVQNQKNHKLTGTKMIFKLFYIIMHIFSLFFI
jgi:hypothetical protein